MCWLCKAAPGRPRRRLRRCRARRAPSSATAWRRIPAAPFRHPAAHRGWCGCMASAAPCGYESLCHLVVWCVLHGPKFDVQHKEVHLCCLEAKAKCQRRCCDGHHIRHRRPQIPEERSEIAAWTSKAMIWALTAWMQCRVRMNARPCTCHAAALLQWQMTCPLRAATNRMLFLIGFHASCDVHYITAACGQRLSCTLNTPIPICKPVNSLSRALDAAHSSKRYYA